MENKKPFKVLIVEDDPRCYEPLKAQIMNDDEFTLVDITDNSEVAYKLITTRLPDVLVIDLMLAHGDGIELLHRLRAESESLPLMPYILVTTAFASPFVMKMLVESLADYVFQKHNGAVNAEKILLHMRIMSSQFQRHKTQETVLLNSADKKEEALRARINSELELYYLSQSTQAKDYLAEAVYQAVNVPSYQRLHIGEIYASVAKLFKKEPHNVDMAIRRVLNTAFMQTCPEELARNYTPYVDIGRGAPRNKEFILYVSNKIKKEIS